MLISAIGMEAQKMTVGDYQALLDRGWRRSGTWLYIPSNKKAECCCKHYPYLLFYYCFYISSQKKKN